MFHWPCTHLPAQATTTLAGCETRLSKKMHMPLSWKQLDQPRTQQDKWKRVAAFQTLSFLSVVSRRQSDYDWDRSQKSSRANGHLLLPLPSSELFEASDEGGATTGRFQRPSERVPFSDEGGFVFSEGGFVFSEAPFKGTLHEAFKIASPKEGVAWRGLQGGLKGAWRGLERGLKPSTLKGASRGLEGGLKEASRGLKGGLKGASSSEGFKVASRWLQGAWRGLEAFSVEGGFDGAWRGLERGLKGASPSEGFKGAWRGLEGGLKPSTLKGAFFFCRCRARSKLWRSSIYWFRLSIPTHENKVKRYLRCLPSR